MNECGRFCFSIMFTDAVKALDEDLTLSVLGLPFGTDRQGQTFDQNTNIGLQPGDAVPAFYWHGYAERNAGAVKSIGKATYERVDKAGHWFKVQLDSASDVARKIYEDAKAGLARASSDSSSHLVRPYGIVGKPGNVTNWPIFAMSLMDSTTAPAAVNPRAIAVAAAKALIEASETDDEATTGEAAKAGAVFAMRNRERIKSLRTLLDEMLAEMPDEEAAPANADTAAKGEPKMDTKIETPAVAPAVAVAVAVEPKLPETPAVDLNAVKADYEARLKAVEDKLAEANRLKFASVNVNTGKGDATKAEDAAAKAYEKAFDAYVRGGSARDVADAAKATMNEGTGSQGGFLPPIKYSQELVTAMNEAVKLRQYASVKTVAGTNSFKVPALTNSSAAVLTAESAAYNQNEPTLAEVTFTPYKYTRISLATDELIADSRFDVFGQILLPDAQNAFAIAENTATATGTGSSQPQGITVGASLGVTAASATAITDDEVVDLFYSLAPEYRDNAVWVMNDATLKAIRKFKDTTNQYIWQPSYQAGQPDMLMGKPVVTLSTMPTMAAANRVIVFGDLSYYWITDFASGSAEFKRLEERYAELGQVGFRWSKRFDAKVMLSAAIKYLRNL